MSFRRIISLTSFLSFILLAVTSVILYIVPHGRVAYWSNWHMWGLSKSEWGNLHINVGVLFLVVVMIHTILNWNAIVNYMKTREKKLIIFTMDFNIAMVLVLITTLCSIYMLPPYSWVIEFGESIKDRASITYGEPPYGHAELSTIRVLAERMRLNPASCVARGLKEILC
jgi:hypothetical protein